MKIIYDYLNTLYKDDDSKDAQELKEELREHLITSVNEFIEHGCEIEEAQNKAIEQFDGNSKISIELRSIYKPKIDVRKERLRKLSGIRWKLINIFGWLLSAAIFTAYMTIEDMVPIWLIALILISVSVLGVLSIAIFSLKKNIEKG